MASGKPRRELVAAEVRAELARQMMTVPALSDATGIAYRTLTRRVSGESPFDTDELDRVARALGVPLAHLWGAEVAA